jgi:hypothetical protein
MRAIRRARVAKTKADASRRAAVIREELARPRAKDCRCPITPDSTLQDLRALGAGGHRRSLGLPNPRRDPREARAMSATDTGRELGSPNSRRRRHARRVTTRRLVLPESSFRSASGPPANGTHRVPDPQPAPMPDLEQLTTPETCWESLQRAERARAGRLCSVWQMTPEQRVAAMRRGDLTYEQLVDASASDAVHAASARGWGS